MLECKLNNDKVNGSHDFKFYWAAARNATYTVLLTAALALSTNCECNCNPLGTKQTEDAKNEITQEENKGDESKEIEDATAPNAELETIPDLYSGKTVKIYAIAEDPAGQENEKISGLSKVELLIIYDGGNAAAANMDFINGKYQKDIQIPVDKDSIELKVNAVDNKGNVKTSDPKNKDIYASLTDIIAKYTELANAKGINDFQAESLHNFNNTGLEGTEFSGPIKMYSPSTGNGLIMPENIPSYTELQIAEIKSFSHGIAVIETNKIKYSQVMNVFNQALNQ